MTTVARGAGTFAVVGIHAANATVRPCIGIKLATPSVFHLAAMALPAAVDCGRSPSTISPSMLSSEPMNRAAAAW